MKAKIIEIIDNADAEQLYDNGQKEYDIMHFIYRSDDNLGMHYGLWENDTENIWQAQQNENEYVKNKLDLSTADVILDAGCGIGGTTISLAKKYGYRMHGITISQNQVNRAFLHAKRLKLRDFTIFSRQDFHHTNFNDNHFSKIYSVESANYANPPNRYLSEMYRILRPGGQLLILDSYLSQYLEKYSKAEQNILNRFCTAWCIPNPNTLDYWLIQAKNVGFKNIQTEDLWEKIVPSAPKFALLANIFRPIYEVFYKLGLLSKARYSNMIAAILQKQLFEKRMLGYHSIRMLK